MRGHRRGAATRGAATRGLLSPGALPSASLPSALRRLLAAAAATSLGEFGLFVAIGVYAYREGGPALVGLAGLVQAVPAVVAAPAVTMLIGDHVSRWQVLLGTNALRSVLLACLCAALIPALARLPQDVSATNALLSTVNNAGFLGGAGAGGVVLAATDPQTVLGLSALAYVAGTALIASIPADNRAARRGVAGRKRAGAQIAIALRTILARAELRVIFVLIAVLSIADGAIGVLVVVAPLRLLDMGTSGIGYLNAACGVGGLATGAVALWFLRRSGLSTGLLTGSLVLGLPLIVVAVVANPAVALFAWACVGLGYSLVKSTSLTLIQRLTPDRSLLGVFGVLESVFVGFLGLGAILAPLLIDAIGLRWTLAATGLLLPTVAAARWGTLRGF